MKLPRVSRGVGVFWAIAMTIFGAARLAEAQSAMDGFTHRIRAAQTVEPLGPSVFGDATNFLDGSTSFTITDVTIPTNGSIPVSIGRRLRPDAQVPDQQNRTTSYGSAVFGPYWDTDIPYMVGTFDAIRGWVSESANGSTQGTPDRCTKGGNGPPPINGVGPFYNVLYPTVRFYSGININIPGAGLQQMMRFPGYVRTQNIGGADYYYKTKENWLVGCIPVIKNGLGEGFTVRLPNGVTYKFDWMVSRMTSYILDDTCGAAPNIMPTMESLTENSQKTSCQTNFAIPRNEIFLYATEAIDRFGNKVEYTFDPDNPEHLLKIESSDGATISLQYGSSGHAELIKAGDRQWKYAYGPALTTVTLPDSSAWTYNYGSNIVGINIYDSRKVWQGCHVNIGTLSTDVAPGTGDSNTMTMTSPSGATGTFFFRRILHGTRQAESGCYLYSASATAINHPPIVTTPSDYQTVSLVKKTLVIPGSPTMYWNFLYNPGWTSPYQSQTIVSDSAGRTTTYTYGGDFDSNNYAELLKEVLEDGSGIVRTTTYQYLQSGTGQNFSDQAGAIYNIPTGYERGFHTLNRPLVGKVIVQQGRTFSVLVDKGCPTSGVYCFDSFVRPTRIVKSSH